MFESMSPEPRRKSWYLLPLEVFCNLFLTWMLISTANVVFLLPFPYRDRLPAFLQIAALGFTASLASGTLYLYRRTKRVAIPGILKTLPVLIWSFLSVALAVVLAISIKAYPNQWSTY